jgi:cobalamin biosynthesis Mg chelatase CobN
MTSTLKALAGAALVAGLLVVASAQPAAAATPCWKTLLNDWYDGRIDNVYPVHCYQDTLKHLPPDVSVYSSARDDILRALQNTPVPAQATTTSPEQSGTTTTAAASGGKSGSGGNGGTGAPKSPDAGGGTSTAGSPGRQTDKGLSGVAQQLNTSSPSSVPVPLIVLGGLAVLLVAAGAAGLIAKRMHSRTPGS